MLTLSSSQLLEGYNRGKTYEYATLALNRFKAAEARNRDQEEDSEEEADAFPIPVYEEARLSCPDVPSGTIRVGQLSDSYRDSEVGFSNFENKLRRFVSDEIVATDGNLIPPDAPYAALADVEDCKVSMDLLSGGAFH